MYYGNVTFVMSLPRSRTAWLAETFDGKGHWTALHDPLKNCASIDELGDLIDISVKISDKVPTIIVDTAAVFFYPQIAKRFPGARYCFVERSILDVYDSLQRAGQPTHIEAIGQAHDKLREGQLRARADRQFVHRVHYSELDYVSTLHNLWRFFGIPVEPSPGYFKDMIETNIQIPFDVQQQRTNRGKVERLMATRHQGW